MKTIWWIAACCVASALGAAEKPAAEAGARSRWEGEWSSRFGESRAEWVLELEESVAGVVKGTLRGGETTREVEGTREGAWLELRWKEADGRSTQARGVAGAGEWRGLTISGGKGGLVEYGRFALKLKPAPSGGGAG
jgi:hypothetical protein